MGETTVRLKALEGGWETCGVDRFPGVVPESVQVTANPAGFDTCSFVLRRDPELIHPDLSAFTDCEIEEDGTLIFEGRVQETPTHTGDDQQITVQGKGWQYHMDDDALQRSWVHSRITEWYDPRQRTGTDLTNYMASGQVENQQGVTVIGYPVGATVTSTQWVGVSLDLLNADAKRVVVDLEVVGSASGYRLFIIGHDVDNGGGASYEQIYADATQATTGVRSGTFTTARRYVTVFMYYSGANTTATVDHLFRLKSIKVFRQAAYESGNASVLKASDILSDGLAFAPLLSQDTSQIEASVFDIIDFAPTEPRTLREYGEAANAFHRQQLKVVIGKALKFAALPSTPKYMVGAGIDFDNASANSGEEIYDQVIVSSTGPDGQPLRVTRTQTGTLVDRRGFHRTKVLAVSAALETNGANQIGDVFLAAHQKTPLRGQITIHPGELWDFASGAPVHPRELVKDTNELIHFSHLIDPDTGAIGRDGQIATVSYDPDTEIASVAVDNSRENLEALLARYSVVSGATPGT